MKNRLSVKWRKLSIPQTFWEEKSRDSTKFLHTRGFRYSLALGQSKNVHLLKVCCWIAFRQILHALVSVGPLTTDSITRSSTVPRECGLTYHRQHHQKLHSPLRVWAHLPQTASPEAPQSLESVGPLTTDSITRSSTVHQQKLHGP